MILPRFEIVPIQAIDSGQVYPRARITFSLQRFLELSAAEKSEEVDMEIQTELDLFDPPKHLACLQAAQQLKSANPQLGYIRIARLLSRESEMVHRLTVRHALRVAAQMAREGLTEPYRVLLVEPASVARWRRRA